ncbi:hypothetical protein DY000_02014468 [Brassica cretica]|uniref:Uncharacterized protein n=1 Tax=Brassica cretica TaxID=69181 RepID=A0ABQ7DAP2_BRACR|nr:hypothetical protein DY000_02014468 [Brassica cretica]
MDFHSGLRTGLLIAFSYLMLLKDPGHAPPKSEDLEIHPSETHGSWMRFFINWRLYGLSSKNPETGWTFVQKPGGWMDFHPGTRRLNELLSWNPEAGWTFKGTF